MEWDEKSVVAFRSPRIAESKLEGKSVRSRLLTSLISGQGTPSFIGKVVNMDERQYVPQTKIVYYDLDEKDIKNNRQIPGLPTSYNS